MSLCRQQSCAAGPSFEDMVAQLEDLKMQVMAGTKEMAQDTSGSLPEALEGLMEDVLKKICEENEKLRQEARISYVAFLGVDEENKKLSEENEKLKKENEKLKQKTTEHLGMAETLHDAVVEENKELKEEMERIQEKLDEMYEFSYFTKLKKAEVEIKKLKEENEKLKNFDNWENHPALRHKAVLDDDFYLELRKENEEWKEAMEEYVEEEEANPDGLRGYLESKTDEIYELHDEMEQIKKRCISDGLEYLLEDK